MVDWSKVTLADVMNALKKLVKPGISGKYVFDVVVFGEGGKEEGKVWVKIENGQLDWAEGASGDKAAVPFQIKKGGMDTMRQLQEQGLQAAMRMMMTGHIYTSNPLGAQKWFDILVIGKDPLEKALSGN